MLIWSCFISSSTRYVFMSAYRRRSSVVLRPFAAPKKARDGPYALSAVARVAKRGARGVACRRSPIAAKLSKDIASGVRGIPRNDRDAYRPRVPGRFGTTLVAIQRRTGGGTKA